MPIYDVTYLFCGPKARMRSKQRQFDMANLQGAKLAALSHLPKNRCDVHICSPQGQLLSVLKHRDELVIKWFDWTN
ncbi:hypothetical protein BTO01_26520 [Vibrio jasicida]|nr:hypothetical protein BTO01_26520 [Vibrio jasicida]